MFPYLVIIIVSLINNWGVQLAYYFYRKRKDPKAFRGQKTLLHYYTGYIGDGIIAPLINILIYYFMVNIRYKPTVYELIWVFVLAVLLDILTHFYQGKMKMTNWSMPRPFQWNFAGYWHMVSFPIQISYLLLFFWILVRNSERVVANQSMLAATAGVFGLMAAFLVLYHFDNRTSQTTSKTLRKSYLSS